MTDDATRTSIGAATLLKKDRLLAGRYRVLDPVGVGGMGLVYRAHDERLNIDVALKVLRTEGTANDSMLKRFERELVMAREVSHPNVVRIHDIGQDGELHFITMDLVQGKSLRDILEDEGPMDPERVVRIVAAIADGLDAAHRRGVVHRDLKPANILMDTDDKPYISDFGIARSMTESGLTRTGVIVGSPDYLAPEQARGEETDGRADIYALGLTLYEMLSGKLPFRGGTIEEMIAQRTAGEPRDITTTGAKVPAYLRRILYRCLHRDPDDRYQHASELATDLRSHRAPGLRVPRIGRRGAFIAAGLAVVAIGATTFTLWMPELSKSATAERLAILPFVDDTGDAALTWMSAGLSEMAGLTLAQNPNIEIIDSSRVVSTLKDLRLNASQLKPDEVNQLIDLLAADRLLSGHLRRSGEQLRIDATLYGSNKVRSFSVETDEANDAANLVSQLSAAVRTALNVAPAPLAPEVLSTSGVALTAYTEGLAALQRGDAVAAAPALEQAVAADPGFAVAWMQLAEAYDRLGYSDQAKRAINRAVEQAGAPDSRVALLARAQQATLQGEYEESYQYLDQLISRFPGDIASRMTQAQAYGDEGRLDQASEILKKVVAEDPYHPRAWYLLGKYAILAGNNHRAIDDYLVRALVIQNRLGNALGRADVLNAMGIAYQRIGDFDSARNNYQQAMQIRQEMGDKRGVSTSLNNLAGIEMLAGDHAAARARLNEAVELSREIGDQGGLAAFINTIGTLAEEEGNYSIALEKFREALNIREEQGDRRALTESFINVGFAYYMMGELDNAKIYWQRALAESRELGNPDTEMQALQSIGLFQTAVGDWNDAIKSYLSALEIARKIDYPEAVAASLGHMAKVAGLQGRVSASLSQFDEALEILRPLGDTRGLIEFGLEKAEVLNRVGLVAAAQDESESVAALMDNSPNPDQLAHLHRVQAAIAISKKDFATATTLINQTKTADADRRDLAATLNLNLIAAQLNHAQGKPQQAKEIAASVRAQAARYDFVNTQLQALYLETLASMDLQETTAALTAAEDMIDLLNRHGPYLDEPQMRVAAYQVLIKAGRDGDAMRQLETASNVATRVRGNLPEQAVEWFDNLPQLQLLRKETIVRE